MVRTWSKADLGLGSRSGGGAAECPHEDSRTKVCLGSMLTEAAPGEPAAPAAVAAAPAAAATSVAATSVAAAATSAAQLWANCAAFAAGV